MTWVGRADAEFFGFGAPKLPAALLVSQQFIFFLSTPGLRNLNSSWRHAAPRDAENLRGTLLSVGRSCKGLALRMRNLSALTIVAGNEFVYKRA